jgi:hypothetical protein
MEGPKQPWSGAQIGPPFLDDTPVLVTFALKITQTLSSHRAPDTRAQFLAISWKRTLPVAAAPRRTVSILHLPC